MITAYFVGFAINGLFSTVPDKLGRKRTTFLVMIMSCIAQTIMLLVPVFAVRTLMFFIMGLSQVKVGVSYVWFSECVGFPYKSTAFTIINIFDGLTLAIQCIYFLYISRNWFWLPFFFTLLSYAATMTILICPESPRWHLVNGRRIEGIKALNRIAEMNETDERISEETIFVEDPTNFDVTVNPKTGHTRYGYSFTGKEDVLAEIDELLVEDDLDFIQEL